MPQRGLPLPISLPTKQTMARAAALAMTTLQVQRPVVSCCLPDQASTALHDPGLYSNSKDTSLPYWTCACDAQQTGAAAPNEESSCILQELLELGILALPGTGATPALHTQTPLSRWTTLHTQALHPHLPRQPSRAAMAGCSRSTGPGRSMGPAMVAATTTACMGHPTASSRYFSVSGFYTCMCDNEM